MQEESESQCSLLDASLQVTEKKWTITLACTGYHAFLLVESFSKNEYEIRRYDLIPQESSASFFSSFSYQAPGCVRSVALAGVKSKEDLRNHLYMKDSNNWITWQVAAKKIRQMQAKINEERRNNSTEKSVKYDTKGIHNGEGHSSLTWAEEKLAIVGIVLNKSSFLTASIGYVMGDVFTINSRINEQKENTSQGCTLN